MKKKVARAKTRVGPPPRTLDRFERLDLSKSFDALRKALSPLHDLDAELALYRIEYAILHPDERLPGQKRTHREALTKMAVHASDMPDRAGPPKKHVHHVFERLVACVNAHRAEQASEATIATFLVWGWVHTYGGDDALAHSFVFDPAKLAALVDLDAAKFVRNAHRALGYDAYDRTDNLGNAETKRRSRAHRAKRDARGRGRAA